MTAETAASRNLAACHICCKLASAELHHCPRCGSAMHLRKSDSIQRTLALLFTACLLYIPANLYPIMITEQLGKAEGSTILGGVVLLIHHGSIPIALVIFLFSVMVPIGKLMSMFYLVWTVERHSKLSPRQRTVMYQVTEFVGKWSMVDVFVVAILVALVHLGGLLEIKPGIAALSFAGVVIVTMIAAESFDARLIWDNMEEENSDDTTS
ncbi:MAG: paraquat-inducible protein A [Gammaproteobacteria bacterium]|jgi:paraquat-inducible protein A|nr:paraquat-inducible protein A [Gammaproteobacteria bacterium]